MEGNSGSYIVLTETRILISNFQYPKGRISTSPEHYPPYYNVAGECLVSNTLLLPTISMLDAHPFAEI
jgi:hypothetical protein